MSRDNLKICSGSRSRCGWEEMRELLGYPDQTEAPNKGVVQTKSQP
jgi:hypothetical protein